MKTPVELTGGSPKFARVWAAWLQNVQWTTFGHGADLVEALGAVGGLTDTVASAERVLKWACETGLIVRGTNTPTPAQRYFDVNGANERAGWTTSGYSPCVTRPRST